MCAILGFTSPSLKKEQVLPYFEKTKSRGPDDTRLEPAGSGMLGFHRLAIMGLHPEGMQPFITLFLPYLRRIDEGGGKTESSDRG